MSEIKNIVLAEREDLVAIADAVRNRTGETGGLTLSDMPVAIGGITGGGGINTSDATATADKIFLNESAYVKDEKVIGTFTIDEELNTQEDLIAEITSALEGKAAGGGNGSSELLDSVISGDIENIYSTASSVRSNCFYECGIITADFPLATEVGSYAFGYCYNLESINLPIIENISEGAFEGCSSLTTICLPYVTEIGGYVFGGCASLTTADLPSVMHVGYGTFAGCTSLMTVNLPLATDIGHDTFIECISLTTVDLPLATDIGYGTFAGCASLTSLILRSEDMCYMDEYSEALVGTPIEAGEGYIYVPDNLVNDYKEDAVWSVYADQIRPLSEYEEV